VIAGGVTLVMICLLSVGALAYYDRQLAQIPRIPLRGALDIAPSGARPLNFLVVGVDSAEGLAPDDPIWYGRDPSLNTDTMMIVRVDPDSEAALLLSIPRDLVVPIPGHGYNRINAAFSYGIPPGNPELLLETIRQNFRIEIHHYLQINFQAFRELVDSLGGIELWFDQPARDRSVGLDVAGSGCQTLDGQQALNYARSRHYSIELRPGVWVEDGTGDLGRIVRQRYFVKQAAKKAIARGARNPLQLNNFIGLAQRHMKIDDTLSPQMILDVADHFNTFNPEEIESLQPILIGNPDGATVRLAPGVNEELFAKFRDTPEGTTTTAPDAPGPAAPALPAPTVPPQLSDQAFVPHPPPDAPC
jgi:LCP family protein required for cell wall assembly